MNTAASKEGLAEQTDVTERIATQLQKIRHESELISEIIAANDATTAGGGSDRVHVEILLSLTQIWSNLSGLANQLGNHMNGYGRNLNHINRTHADFDQRIAKLESVIAQIAGLTGQNGTAGNVVNLEPKTPQGAS